MKYRRLRREIKGKPRRRIKKNPRVYRRYFTRNRMPTMNYIENVALKIVLKKDKLCWHCVPLFGDNEYVLPKPKVIIKPIGDKDFDVTVKCICTTRYPEAEKELYKLLQTEMSQKYDKALEISSI